MLQCSNAPLEHEKMYKRLWGKWYRQVITDCLLMSRLVTVIDDTDTAANMTETETLNNLDDHEAEPS